MALGRVLEIAEQWVTACAAAHAVTHCSAISSTRPRSSSSSGVSTSMRTWWTVASTSPLNSKRRSQTTEKSSSRVRSARARSSTSAVVASRPATRPKLIRMLSSASAKVIGSSSTGATYPLSANAEPS
jgi:hypothetical protein